MLDGAPLPASALIRDFQGRTVGYVANVVEQTLLLPKDMAELRSMRRHEVFLSLKRYLAMVCPLLDPFFLLFFFLIFFYLLSFSSFSNPCFFPRQAIQASFRVEEIDNYCHQQMKEEEGRRNAA